MDHERRWDARRWLWGASSSRSVQMCGRGLFGEGVDVMSAHRGHLRLEGIQRCSNVWLCPFCAPRITRHRHGLLVQALRHWPSVSFGTLTVDERRGETLKARRERLAATWRAATKHMKRDYGDLWKYVRVMELARGSRDQGHPHFHVIVLEQYGGTYVGEDLLGRWLRAAPGARLSGQDIRTGDSGAALNYLAKEAFGSTGKSSSHWRVLDEALDGVPGAYSKWRSIEANMRGARQVVVSRGLYADAGVDDVPDELAPDESLEEFLLDTVGKCAWRRLARRPDILAEATVAWQNWDLASVDEALAQVKSRRYSDGVHGLGCTCSL